MPVGITMQLEYCKKCMQMTNHRKLIYNYPTRKEILTCLKCRIKKGLPHITEFNKNMGEEERNYYGEEFNENR